jgi:2-dehydro-3-deoxy-D-arabinonate dehydratase
MKIYKTKKAIIVAFEGKYFMREGLDWNSFINRKNLFNAIRQDLIQFSETSDAIELIQKELEAPIQSQEVWACGVTYYRSRNARMEESKDAGGGSFYDRVYEAERPEVFFKATPHRVVGSGGKVRIRKDSTWDVPEPELTLFVSTEGTIEGYTVGNDMSSRSIEGENPLYLPQAKTYDKCAAIGPCIYVSQTPLTKDTTITLEIFRAKEKVFSGNTDLHQLKRTPEEMVGFLFRESSFPQGCFLMTGTGIIPPNEFTLQSGDEIQITIEPIGTLVNTVE